MTGQLMAEVAALRRIARRSPSGPNTRSIRIAQLRVRIKQRLRRMGVVFSPEISNHDLIALVGLALGKKGGRP